MLRTRLCASIGELLAAGAFAQTAEPVDQERVEDTIIVYGTKFEQSLIDVTDSVSVVSAEEIQREPVADLYDIVERIPNVQTASGEQGSVICEVDERGVGGGGSGLTITTYVDARLGYEFNDNYRATLNVRNLFDEEYYQFVNRDFDANGNFINGTARIGDPQVLGLRLEANF